MRKVFIKFTDNRSRENATITTIFKEKENLQVQKQAVYPEGYENLQKMNSLMPILRDTYPECHICKITLLESIHAAQFEYIDGKSLADYYFNAMEAKDREEFFRVIAWHKNILMSNVNNLVSFAKSEDFEALFGDSEPYVGKPAFKISDFEATAFNIIINKVDGVPTIFDYECIYEFPIPVDIVLYHCVYRTLYLCAPQVAKFIKRAHFFRALELETDKDILEATWKTWRENFSFNRKGQAESDLTKEEFSTENLNARYVKKSFQLQSILSSKSIYRSQKRFSLFELAKKFAKRILPPSTYLALKHLLKREKEFV